jgi:hypothetical protein
VLEKPFPKQLLFGLVTDIQVQAQGIFGYRVKAGHRGMRLFKLKISPLFPEFQIFPLLLHAPRVKCMKTD